MIIINCTAPLTHIKQRQNKSPGSGLDFAHEDVHDLTNEVRKQELNRVSLTSKTRGMVEQCWYKSEGKNNSFFSNFAIRLVLLLAPGSCRQGADRLLTETNTTFANPVL